MTLVFRSLCKANQKINALTSQFPNLARKKAKGIRVKILHSNKKLQPWPKMPLRNKSLTKKKKGRIVRSCNKKLYLAHKTRELFGFKLRLISSHRIMTIENSYRFLFQSTKFKSSDINYTSKLVQIVNARRRRKYFRTKVGRWAKSISRNNFRRSVMIVSVALK